MKNKLRVQDSVYVIKTRPVNGEETHKALSPMGRRELEIVETFKKYLGAEADGIC